MNRLRIPSVIAHLCFLPCFIGSSGCSAQDADLGDSSRLASTPPPRDPPGEKELWKVVDDEQFLGGFSVSHGKIIWFSGVNTREPRDSTVQKAQGFVCDVENCANSNVSIWANHNFETAVHAAPYPLEVYADDTYFYWNTLGEDPNRVGELESVLIRDASRSGPKNAALVTGLMMDGELYGCNANQAVEACTLANCAKTLREVTPKLPLDGSADLSPCPRAASDGYLYATSGFKVFRYRPTKMGAPSEVLYTGHTEEMQDFATNGREVFWIEDFLGRTPHGVLKACPVAGCSEAPRVLLRDIGHTRGLFADEHNVYVLEPQITNGAWEYEVLPGGDRITRVPISGTEAPTILVEGVGITGPMLINDQHIYFAGANSRYDNYIAAVPK